MDSTTSPHDTLSTTSLYLRRGLRHSNPDLTAAEHQEGRDFDFVHHRFGLFIFLVSLSIALAFFLFMFLRKRCWTKYGNSQERRTQTNQIQSDEELAQELQRQLNEETREQDRLEKRKERREWYVSYIKPYTMVRFKWWKMIYVCVCVCVLQEDSLSQVKWTIL